VAGLGVTTGVAGLIAMAAFFAGMAGITGFGLVVVKAIFLGWIFGIALAATLGLITGLIFTAVFWIGFIGILIAGLATFLTASFCFSSYLAF